MIQNHRRLFWPILAVSVALCGGLVYAYAQLPAAKQVLGFNNAKAVAQNFPEPTLNREDYVKRRSLWPRLRENLNALGDRLERPGKERLTFTGTLNGPGYSQPEAVTAVLEFPDRLRLTMQRGAETRVIMLKDGQARGIGGTLDEREQDLIETLAYDTVEHFFAEQGYGMATRFLGSHFRADDGKQPNYSGPFYDIYQTTEQLWHGAAFRQRTKVYCFNSETLLLERVSYQVGPSTPVEVRIAGWQEFQGQRVPTRIVRLVDGAPIVTLIVGSMSLTAKIEDEIFSR